MKVRHLRQRLSKAGFSRLKKRGKGSHSIWQHPVASITIIQSGRDGKDAKPYQIKAITLALKKVNHH